ncbi:MAG: hypothetical protein JWR63_1747 [Conexibacter sp.]|nr:hypothetical protein [Conexibacter sp.]
MATRYFPAPRRQVGHRAVLTGRATARPARPDRAPDFHAPHRETRLAGLTFTQQTYLARAGLRLRLDGAGYHERKGRRGIPTD